MNSENVTTVCICVFSAVFIIALFSMFSIISLSNSKVTFEIKMDENTQEYLGEHHYCMRTISEPYGTAKPSITFAGECEYLNMSILDIKNE